MELQQASRQWTSRPDDERFVSLHELHAHTVDIRNHSKGKVVACKDLHFAPAIGDETKGLTVQGANGVAFAPTHNAFQQLATLAKAPAGYLRELPAPIAADCLNYGMQFKRDVDDVGLLLQQSLDAQGNVTRTVRAATGPNYGRVWNAEITHELVERFGDGVSGDWRVPGEFGKQVAITKNNTTLYASDRDMFVFLADETNRIEVPNRRNGKPGGMAKGFFLRNSETGNGVIGIAMFLFDYACCNRIVWGAEGFKEIRIRHTSGAPDRWFNEIVPMLHAYRNASEEPIQKAFEAAKARKVEDLEKFLKTRRYAASMAPKLQEVHKLEEGRPVETVFDVVTALTAYARGVPFQDERVALEMDAGKMLELVAA